jgi:uncharacterized protein YaaR (DUF327 family)
VKINKTGAGALPVISDHEMGLKPGKALGRFATDLIKSQDKQAKERLTVLLDQITSQGKKLAQTPTYSALKAYRELVSHFIGEAVGNMYEVQSQTGWDRQGRQKMYTIIKGIDTAMEDLTEDVRCGQGRELDILAKQDAIRGMLVDLYT